MLCNIKKKCVLVFWFQKKNISFFSFPEKHFFLVFEKHSISESEGIKDEGTGSDSIDEIRVRSQTSLHSGKKQKKNIVYKSNY